jgi:hypothetical protein
MFDLFTLGVTVVLVVSLVVYGYQTLTEIDPYTKS